MKSEIKYAIVILNKHKPKESPALFVTKECAYLKEMIWDEVCDNHVFSDNEQPLVFDSMGEAIRFAYAEKSKDAWGMKDDEIIKIVPVYPRYSQVLQGYEFPDLEEFYHG